MKHVSWKNKNKKTKFITSRKVLKFAHGKRYTHRLFTNEKFNKKYILLSCCFIFILFGIYLFFFSNVFTITDIEVKNTKILDPQTIEQSIIEYFSSHQSLLSQQNFFLLSKEKLSKAILNNFLIENVTIKKRPFTKLIIEVQERASKLTWISGPDYFYLDDQGYAIESILVANITVQDANKEGQPTEPEYLTDDSKLNTLLPQVIDESESTTLIGDKVLTETMVSFITKLHENITRKTDLEIINYRLTQTNYTELKAITNQNFFIYFESTNDLDRQLENLSLVVREKVATTTEPIEYIDLRDENNIVYIK